MYIVHSALDKQVNQACTARTYLISSKILLRLNSSHVFFRMNTKIRVLYSCNCTYKNWRRLEICEFWLPKKVRDLVTYETNS